MQLPLLVSVTQLRRKTSDVLRQVADSGRPVFVTQYGSVELVLLTRRTYERLLRAAEQGAASGAEPQRAGATEQGRGREAAGMTDGAPSKASGAAPSGVSGTALGGAPAAVAADPLAVFGRLPRGTLFETRWGLVDAGTAAFFLEEGEEVKPHLSPERLRAALDGIR
jgi:prevent-host-death family protein